MRYLIAIFMILFLVSCQSTTEKEAPKENQTQQEIQKQLTKNWTIQSININTEKVADPEIDSMYNAQMKGLLADSYILFDDNGRFSEQVIDQHRKGKWILKGEDFKTINLTFPNFKEDWTIQYISEDSLSLLAQTNDGQKLTITCKPTR